MISTTIPHSHCYFWTSEAALRPSVQLALPRCIHILHASSIRRQLRLALRNTSIVPFSRYAHHSLASPSTMHICAPLSSTVLKRMAGCRAPVAPHIRHASRTLLLSTIGTMDFAFLSTYTTIEESSMIGTILLTSFSDPLSALLRFPMYDSPCSPTSPNADVCPNMWPLRGPHWVLWRLYCFLCLFFNT